MYQAEDGIRDAQESRGLGDVYKRQALGRVTANAVYARISSPHYNACAMDGIALEAKRTFGASETTPARLSEDDFVWVNTGDPLPEGCDAVVMVEDVVQELSLIHI